MIVALSVVGVSSAILALATMHGVDRSDLPLHTASAAAARAPQKAHRHSYIAVPRNLLSGVGSWYGDMFDGHQTASGEIFDKAALTACHPTLPFGTLVRVINLRNRKSVVVRINDRGIRPDRIIDLSLAAADKIGMRETGVAPVRIVVLSGDRG